MEIIKKDGSPIELIRFFEYQGKKILIFNNGDGIDANGHITIHICNVDMTNGPVANAIQESDMDMIRNIIKTIVKENSTGNLSSIKDLNYNDLNGVVIYSDWPLKMMPNYVDVIKRNQPTFEISNNFVSSDNSFNSFSNLAVDEQPMFNGLSVNNADLNPSTLNENVNFNQEENMVNNNFSFDNAFGYNNQIQNEQVFNQNIVNDNIQPVPMDYEKMYYEQLTINNSLNMELELYKNKIQQLKNIIEN